MNTIPRTSDLHGLVVRPVRAVRSTGLALALRELGDVAEVVALHLEVEDLRGRSSDHYTRRTPHLEF